MLESTYTVEQVRTFVEAAFGEKDPRLPTQAIASLLERGFELLESGECRAATREGSAWRTHEWVKKLILLSFRVFPHHLRDPLDGPCSYDRVPLAFAGWSAERFRKAAIRVVPGAVARAGSYIGRDVVLMPCFVNVGAYVGRGTMIDTWSTVGSCAQVGDDCHISGGVGIGGVLEPINATPVIIEDGVFVGARSEIAEGVCVRRGAVVSMGVFLGKSTPIVVRSTGEILYGEIPENAVVVPGALASEDNRGLSTYAAVIVKEADDRTRQRVARNLMVRTGADMGSATR